MGLGIGMVEERGTGIAVVDDAELTARDLSKKSTQAKNKTRFGEHVTVFKFPFPFNAQLISM